MPWTANVISVQPRANDPGVVEVSVVATDGVSQKFAKTFTPSSAVALKQLITNQIAQVETVVGVLGTVSVGPFDLTPDAAPKDDPAADALAAFLVAYRTYVQTQKAVTLGLVASDDPSVSAASKAMATAFDPSYLSVL